MNPTIRQIKPPLPSSFGVNFKGGFLIADARNHHAARKQTMLESSQGTPRVNDQTALTARG